MHVVVVGNGIAGVTAARHVRKADPDARITMVSEESREPFARTALMYIYMGVLTRAHTHLYDERFWAESRIDRVLGTARALDPTRQRLALDDGSLDYDRLLVATGSTSVVPDWPGVTLDGVQGLYHLSDLDRLEASSKHARRAVVVGGGLIGVELAEMLATRGVAVTFLVREPRYLAPALSETESALVAAAIRQHGIDLRLGTEVASVEGETRAEAVVTTDGERIGADVVGVGIGVRPNVGWLDGALATDRGVLVDDDLRASAENVWAAGDCAQLRTPPPGVRAVEPIWYTARLQGATAGLGMAGRPRAYAPPVFFNSAKFFDLEWQLYGDLAGPATDWERSDGARSVRIRHRDGVVVGVSGLGVRLRQAVCSRWIEERWPLDRAVADLPAARFDAEFTTALAG
ncbi:NAD(P)/FAD-dependent oxidoreductase [Rubrivirga sp. IMCC45206]|uniref:NAD(P)/FAD-dependent oxidoreductase n=1 Tax=Rubrivirga sp. IMCC45206 TaxID=3391614 RepID=UPI00398F97BF